MSLNRIEDARATYTEATKTCKDSIPLWLLLADLEVSFLCAKNVTHLQTGRSRECDKSEECGGEGEAEEPWQRSPLDEGGRYLHPGEIDVEK